MTLAGLVGLVGIAGLLYGGYLAAITTDEGNTPFEASGTVVCFAGLLILGAAFGIGKLIERQCEGGDFDPVDDFLIVATILGGVVMAAFVVSIVVAFL